MSKTLAIKEAKRLAKGHKGSFCVMADGLGKYYVLSGWEALKDKPSIVLTAWSDGSVSHPY